MTDLINQKHATLSRQVIQGKKMTLKTLNTKMTVTQIKNVYILADISGSMSGNKMDELKKALKTIYRPGIKIYAFSTDVYELQESDISQLYAMDRTAMLLALEETWKQLPRHIILATDGQPDERKDDILRRAQVHSDVPIDTIGISEHGRYGYDPEFLSELSRITGGKFTDAGMPVQLTSIIQNLLLEAGETEKGGVIKL